MKTSNRIRHGWQLNSTFWSRLANACGPRKWKRTYLEDTYRFSMPNAPGVYLICVSALDGLDTTGGEHRLYKQLYNAIYVGQTTNLRNRFADHVRGNNDIRKARTIFRRLHFWYASAAKDELNDLEQCFLDALGPTANDRNVMASIGKPIPAGSVKNHHKKG